ncbi:hypothetical protein [Bradyrhizobium paxllaeri]|uniref:hypothetical protein n=1 Tax=Bradyrhizobium paxllaeri TaxID=190148 RepID=UPI000A015C6A|nr:hypothetical protein [Bradyrhizobium paxllaeri]
MTPRMREIIRQVAAEHGLHPVEVATRKTKSRYVLARVDAARRLRAARYSTMQIGAALGVDHSTVSLYLGHHTRKQPPTMGRWHKPHVRLMRGSRLRAFLRGEKLSDYLARQLALPAPDSAQKPPKRRRRYLVPYAGAGPDYQWKVRSP